MGSRDSPYQNHDGTLEPLDDVGFPPPFHNMDVVAHTPLWSDGSPLDETPTTATAPLPTPRHPMPGPGVLDIIDHPNSFLYTVSSPDWDLGQPPAPILKDMDSFTEGTGASSFDFSLRSVCSSEQLSGRPYLEAPTIHTSTSNEHLSVGRQQTIETWRDEVSVLSTPTRSAPLPTDTTSQHRSTDDSRMPLTSPTSWQPIPARPPKRQLSSTSLDGDGKRGRKLIRRGAGMFVPRCWNQSPSILLSCKESEIDHERPARSSSAPYFM